MTAPSPDPTGLAALKAALDLPKQVLDLGCELVRDLVGEPVKVAGGMLSDQVYAWQWSNRVRIAHRAAEIMERDGIARRIVPPSFLLPLLDAAGNVEDPDLQELWARLLASGVAADEHQHPMWVKLVAQMSAEDARAFAAACLAADGVGLPHADASPWGLDAEHPRYVSHVRLVSLGLIVPVKNAASWASDEAGPEIADLEIEVGPTRLGAQFRRAVIPRCPPAT